MAINLTDETSYVSHPVISQQRFSEKAILAIIRTEQRDRLKKNLSTNQLERIPNGTDRSGRTKYKQELVIHCIAMPGTTMEAKIGGEGSVPTAGDRVRVILKAKGFGDWIEARKNHRSGRLNVGDKVTIHTQWAQQYDQDGNPKGGKIMSQAEADKVPRNVTLGFYGPLTLSEPTAADEQWVAAAEVAWNDDDKAKREVRAIPAGDPVGQAEEDGGW
jgi:hypothetical protein